MMAAEQKTENKDTKSGGRTSRSSDAKRGRKRRERRERPQSEFDQKIIDIRRVTRVVSGGRRFSFSVAVVIGDHKGRVGVGLGKSGDTSLAISKAARSAEKNLVRINRTDDDSIAHEVKAKYNASIVEIRPAPGRGLVAGSSVRDVLEMAGVKDVSTKLLSRSKNKLNNARAAIKALKKLQA